MSDHSTTNNLAPRFEDSRVTLIHSEMMEFVMTHKQKSFGLYPMLNLIALLIQKPLLLVVFRNKPHPGIDPADWTHSLRAPAGGTELRTRLNQGPTAQTRSQRLDAYVNSLLADEGTYDDWLVEFQPAARRTSTDKPPYNIWALGVLYLDIKHKEDTQGQGKKKIEYGNCIDPDNTQARLLAKADLALVRQLRDSLWGFTTEPEAWSENQAPDRSHYRHVARYWQDTRDGTDKDRQAGKAIFFDRTTAAPNGEIAGISAKELRQLLKPVFREIDAIYRDLRGGVPGEFQGFSSRSEAGAPLIWSRHREAQARAKDDWRPPTIGFYMQVRAPGLNPKAKSGYRIIPIATRSMCLDEAAILLQRIKNSPAQKAGVLQFLADLGISEKKIADNHDNWLSDKAKLAEVMAEATSLDAYLKGHHQHSNTYPAFLSGISTFTNAKPSGKCDRFAYGPEFLEEEGKLDTVFVKPTLVSGFPYISFTTKTRSNISLTDREADQPVSFDTFYYNFIFQAGIVRRWISRRLRSAVEDAYLQAIQEAFAEELQDRCEVVIADGSWGVRPSIDWISKINKRLDKVSQAFPYALIQISSEGEATSSELDAQEKTMERFFLFGQKFKCERLRNNYYGRKLIDDDKSFMKKEKVYRSIKSAISSAEERWSIMVGKIGKRIKSQEER